MIFQIETTAGLVSTTFSILSDRSFDIFPDYNEYMNIIKRLTKAELLTVEVKNKLFKLWFKRGSFPPLFCFSEITLNTYMYIQLHRNSMTKANRYPIIY